MELEQALRIVDPDTCYEALRPYAGDCDMLHAEAVQASRIVVDAYRAAIKDLEWAAKAYDFCGLCAGGLSGNGACVHEGELVAPGCEACGKCRCAGCVKHKRWKWRGPGGTA